jgi:hypothetical protein
MNTVRVQAAAQGRVHVSVQVVQTVAEHRDTVPVDLPPLFEVIDPDALDTLFNPVQPGVPLGTEVTFTYVGHEVTVADDGEVVIMVKGAPKLYE